MFSFHTLHAQNQWDVALDRYEKICEDCLRLKEDVLEGKNVKYSDLESLQKELTKLRLYLNDAESSMSGAQKERFLRILRSYSGKISGKKDAFDPELTSFTPPYASAVSLTPEQGIIKPSTFQYIKPTAEAPAAKVHKEKGQNTAGAIIFAGIPEGSIGLMGFYMPKNVGAFLKASITPLQRSSSFSCNSDGYTQDGGLVWTTGDARRTALSVSAGVVYKAVSFADVYLGAGYGSSRLLWKEVSGKWMEVSDKSGKGLDVDAGVLVPVGHFRLMCGIATVSFKKASLQLGIGYKF